MFCLTLKNYALMQILKDNVRNSIIKYAEEEFLEKGFTDASLRTIAARVGISVSTIYSYYKNKDELMTAVCRPFINSMMQITKERHSESTTLEDMMDIEKQQETAKLFISFVTKYRDIIRLILYKSEGSTVNNFRDNYTDATTAHILWFFRKMKMKYPHINTDISTFFIHANCAWMLSIIGEMASHDLSDSELDKFASDFVHFSTSGWASLFGVDVK